jgi:hypothetical protein
VEGLIRGDVSFTSKTAKDPFYVRFSQGFPLCSDFENLKDYESYGIPKQEVPQRMLQLKNESLDQWRDRMYEEFRIPNVLAALTDLKLAYVEIINPLLSRRIVYQSRQLSNSLRNQKFILKQLVDRLCPGIKMASDGATAQVKSILRSPEVIEIFRKEFTHPQCVISEKFCNLLLDNLKSDSKIKAGGSSFKALLKRYLPTSLKNGFRSLRSHSTLDYNALAFRAYTIIKLNRLLNEDVAAMASLNSQTRNAGLNSKSKTSDSSQR